VTARESVDLYVSLADSGTERLRWMQVHRGDWGNAELFVLVYAAKSALRYEGYQDGAGIPHQGRRSEPFLRTWQGAMNHWASGNRDVLEGSSDIRSREFGRLTTLRPTSHCVTVTPSPPARPELSSSVFRTPEPFLDHRRTRLATL
jgi:hypothetical protein